MPNTRIFKECTVGASLITTFRVIGRLLCIAGLLMLLAGSKDAFAQSAVVEQLPSTVDSTEQDERIVEVRLKEMRLLKSQNCHNLTHERVKFLIHKPSKKMYERSIAHENLLTSCLSM